jgi:hypothetical protein
VLLGVFLALGSDASPLILAGWIAAAVCGQMLEVPTGPRDRVFLGIGVVAAAAVALRDPWTIGAIAALSAAIAGLVATGRDERRRFVTSFHLAEIAGMWAFALASYPVYRIARVSPIGGDGAALLAVAAGGIAWFAFRTLVRTLTGARSSLLGFRYVWITSLRSWPSVVAVFTFGALFGLLAPVFTVWAFPAAAFQYGFAHLALRRYYDAERTYRQTIEALSRITEITGLSAPGHGAATARLAGGIARMRGLHPRTVDVIERSALLHEVGLMTLADPAVAASAHSEAELAAWGAAIIATATELEPVAEVVRRHALPYRRRGQESDSTVPLESRIVRTAGAYDRAVRAQGATPNEALEFLHLNTAYDFDPDVLRTLRRYLIASDVITPAD